MEFANEQIQERPALAVEDRITEAIEKGLKVIASIRGFRVAFNPVVTFYIDLVAVDPKTQQEIEIGFWPGMTNELASAESELAGIKASHPAVKIVHLKDPVYLRDTSTPDTTLATGSA